MNSSEFSNAMNCPLRPCQCEWDGTEGTERRSLESLIQRRREAELRELETRIRAATYDIPTIEEEAREASWNRHIAWLAELDRLATADTIPERILLASQTYALPILVGILAGVVIFFAVTL